MSLLHPQHRCSPIRRLADPSPSWQLSRSLERERELTARLFFRREHEEPAREISAPVISAGVFYGFVAQVAIGTPSTMQTVLIDSTASFSWIQCEPCSSITTCYDQDGPFFNPDNSKTYRKLPCLSLSCLRAVGNTSDRGPCQDEEDRCLYYMKYMDGSASFGRVGTDTLTFGEEAIPGFVFGCSNYHIGEFGRYMGIFGFAASGQLSILSQVGRRKTGQYQALSYYLPSPTSVGYIQVGRYDEDELDFTPMFRNGSDNYIALTSIMVDGYAIELTGSSLSPRTMAMPCYLDLGTSFTVLPNQTFRNLRDAVTKRTKGYDRIQSTRGCCEPAFLSTERVILAVQLHFRNGVRLQLDEKKLMYKGRDGRLCLGSHQAKGIC
ncbi:hypothetical protein QOZ80_1BG0071350 [Eleusine coracana subsp. coracana]|nr:hypothetical protein QOZ80_1BG0071350 [Eleusine coracana subsp. coracana]